MIGYGKSHGAVTVVNAIPCGKGAAIGIGLSTVARFETADEGTDVTILNDPSENTLMAETCVRMALDRIGETPSGWRLTVDSEIPPARGLKSSSSACNAIVEAVFDAYGFAHEPMDTILLGVSAARSSGVTVTGALDDAVACHLGGLVISDNINDRILKHTDIGHYTVMISVGEKKSNIPIPSIVVIGYKDSFEELVRIAMDDPFEAMTINGRMVAEMSSLDNGFARRAIDAGAVCAGISGTGPSCAALFEGSLVPDGSIIYDGTVILSSTRGTEL